MLPTLTALSGGVDTSVAEVRQRVAAGEQLLVQSPPRIDVQLLRRYPAYVAWREAPSQKQDSAPTRSDDAVETPEEALDHAAAAITPGAGG